MKSALSLIAHSKGSDREGLVALLEVAQDILDRRNDTLAAVYIDMALHQILSNPTLLEQELSDGISVHG